MPKNHYPKHFFPKKTRRPATRETSVGRPDLVPTSPPTISRRYSPDFRSCYKKFSPIFLTVFDNSPRYSSFRPEIRDRQRRRRRHYNFHTDGCSSFMKFLRWLLSSMELRRVTIVRWTTISICAHPNLLDLPEDNREISEIWHRRSRRHLSRGF